jgi:ribonucleoside-diphosphate reductase alpha chain
MFVYKRNQKKEPVCFDQILQRIVEMSGTVENDLPRLNVDCGALAQKVISKLVSGMTTQDIDLFTARIAAESCLENPDYQQLAARILVNNHHKSTFKTFSAKIKMFQARVDENGNLSPMLNPEFADFVFKHAELIDSTIDYHRDYFFDFFGFHTLYDQYYLLRLGDKVIERPQDMFMRVALFIHFDKEYPEESLWEAFETYNGMSSKYFIHASPTLFNSGLKRAGCISCYLGATDDSRAGIKRISAECVDASASCGGIAFSASKWRSKGALIRSSGGRSNGIVPFIKYAQSGVDAFDQGARRRGRLAVYLDMHHPDLMEFIKLRRHDGGDESARCHEVFIALWVSDLFMKRVEAGELWSFFDSDACPNLLEVYGQEYEELYLKLEAAGKYKSQKPARDIWREIYITKQETGIPYLMCKDAVNRYNNQSNIGLIRNSNLCTEIVEYCENDDAFPERAETACCTLASLALPSFVKGNSFDYGKLAEITATLVRNLNKIIDRSSYPSEAARRGSLNHRPIGIGVQGLADVFYELGLSFDSEEATELNKRIFETIYYAAVTESSLLAREVFLKSGKTQPGYYKTFRQNGGAPLARGIFNFELYGLQTTDLLQGYDWESLRSFIRTYGVRNSLMVALMPTQTTSQMFGNTECFEPLQANIYARRVMSGEYYVINKHMYSELKSMGAWSPEVIEALKDSQGSVQGLKQLSETFRNRYKTAWELKQKYVVQQAADRQPFVDQSQSMNMWFEDFDQEKFTASHFTAWKAGLKTLSYYVRQRPATKPVQTTLSKTYTEDARPLPTLENYSNSCGVCGT